MRKNQYVIPSEYKYLFDETNKYSCEAFQKYIKRDVRPYTLECYYNDIKLFFQFLISINKNPKDISNLDLIEYIGVLLDKNLSASRIKCRHAAIVKYFDYLVDIKLYSKSDYGELLYKIKMPRVKYKKQTRYTKEYANAIIDVFKKEWEEDGNFTGFMAFVFLVIAASTGARRKEIAMLKITDIDFENGRIHFFETKNGDPRSGVLLPEVCTIIKEYLIERKNHTTCNTKNLFINKHGKESNVNAICASIVFIAKKHNMHIEFHAFRRGFATELSINGTGVELIAKALGHKSLTMTTRYIDNDNLVDNAVLNYSLFNRKENKNILEEKIIAKNNTNENTSNTPNENNNTSNNNNLNILENIGNTFNANLQNINPAEALNILVSNMLLNSNANNNQNIMNYSNNTSSSKKVEPLASGGQESSSNSNFDFSNMLFLISNVANEMGKMYQSINV